MNIHRLDHRGSTLSSTHQAAIQPARRETTPTAPGDEWALLGRHWDAASCDMVLLNRMSRCHLMLEALNRFNGHFEGTYELRTHCEEMLAKHTTYIREHLEFLTSIRNWIWTPPLPDPGTGAGQTTGDKGGLERG